MPCPSLSFSFTLLVFFFPPLSLAPFPCLHTCCLFSVLLSQPPFQLTLIRQLSPHRSSFPSFSFSPHLQLHSFTLFPSLILSILSYLSDSAPSGLHLSSPLPCFPTGSSSIHLSFRTPTLRVCAPSPPSPLSPPPPHKLSILSFVQQQDV